MTGDKVIANGMETNYVDLNKVVQQGSLWTVIILKENYDSAPAEVNNIENWTEINRMPLNISGKSACKPCTITNPG